IARWRGYRLSPARLGKLLPHLTNNPTLRVSPPSEDRAALEKKITELCRAGGNPVEITELAERFIVSLQSEFCEWARQELSRRKTDRRVQSFDDMLTRLDEALRGERGNQLRKSLLERFTVDVVDEFQDTDSVQYSIISLVDGGSERSVLFIGDLRQAIYAFCGSCDFP